MRVGVDTGGTFTDVVDERGELVKVLSDPADPSGSVAEGIDRVLDGVPPSVLAHGTTVATNALLERRGGRVALITNAGFSDLLEIGRQDRPSLYDPWADRPEPLVPRQLRLEVAGRLGPDGREMEPLGPVPPVDDVDAVAVCLLHADLNPDHERAVAATLAGGGYDIVLSSEVSPEFREYERLSTTVLDAYLRAPCRRYLEDLPPLADEVLVMTSAGGLVPLADAASRPVRLLLSGPAGGVVAGAAAAVAAGFEDCVTFDMGGTSTDVCLVLGGEAAPAAQRAAAGFPVRLPALDVHTIGAGGGSIARLDPGGALVVGPRSAGAVPGPACYGRGGEEATVTDADLVAGRLPPAIGYGALGDLDVAAAERALDRAGVTSEGVIAVVDAAMVQAVRAVTVERGIDPRHLALVAFGGAGPLHACAIAAELGMPAVVVPPRAGVLSAAGIVTAPRRLDLVRTWPEPLGREGLDEALASLVEECRAGLGDGAVVARGYLDCRYAGQSHELTAPSVVEFEEEHRLRNGFGRPGALIEVVALRATAVLESPLAYGDLPAPGGRQPVVGPRVVAEPDTTLWIPEGWSATVDASGSWVVTPE